MSASDTLESSPWYRSLNGEQWKALIASNLGWTFDGFEVFALILTIGAALHQSWSLPNTSSFRLRRRGHCDKPYSVGEQAACWAAILADYIGRKRSMTLTILAYSALTGLSALSWNCGLLPRSALLLGLRSARNGRRERQSRLKLWPDKARGRVARFCNADTRSEAFLLPPSGWSSVRPVPALGATCI